MCLMFQLFHRLHVSRRGDVSKNEIDIPGEGRSSVTHIDARMSATVIIKSSGFVGDGFSPNRS